MTTLCHFLLFVFITSCFRIGNTIEVNDDQVTQVHVMNALPKDSAPLEIRCNSADANLDAKQLKSGYDYSWRVEEETATYFCEAFWGNKFASWHAFETPRDANQKRVFWLIKENGFFLGYDNSSWVEKSTWETE